MTRRSTGYACAMLALVLCTTAACTRPTQDTPEASSTAQIEEFTEETLAEYQGKVVLLNFWAIWCPPCRNEMPDMEAVYREYSDQGLVILAVNVAESSQDISAFAGKLDLTFPIFRDNRKRWMNTYGVDALPTTIFINREGQIVSRNVGSMDQDELSARVEQLLN